MTFVLQGIRSGLSAVCTTVGHAVNSKVTFVLGGVGAAGAIHHYFPAFNPRNIDIKQTALNVRQWAQETAFPAIQKTWNETVVPTANKAWNGTVVSTVKKFYQEKMLPIYKDHAVPFYQTRVVPFCENQVTPFVVKNVTKFCDTFYHNGEITRVGVGVGVASAIFVAGIVGEAVNRRLNPDTRPTQADLDALVAELNVRPTQAQFDEIVEERDARPTQEDFNTMRTGCIRSMQYLSAVLRFVKTEHANVLHQFIDTQPTNDRSGWNNFFNII